MAMARPCDLPVRQAAALLLACALALLAVQLRPCRAQQQQQPPSPGYYPSGMFRPLGFSEAYRTLWGSQHQTLSPDGKSLTLWMDSSSGSGFKSARAYRNGYFGASVRVQPGYTAGVNTAFYLSNSEEYPGHHDEIDMELLGTVPGEPYTLQTNVYVRGSGDGTIVGREMRFHLWFDPTADFHHYAIIWNPDQILFLVDDVPVRRYERKAEATFPDREMWAYGSIWDASDWATDGGRYRADYRYQPFVSRFASLRVGGCAADASADCQPVPASPASPGTAAISAQQEAAMRWAQRNSMVYYYCLDSTRDRALYPEC